jgi:FAD/FMN-containing dehydrogenase
MDGRSPSTTLHSRAIAERARDDGAVGNRDAAFVCGVAGCWLPNDPGGPGYQRWVRDSWEALRPFSTGGVYVNFQTADEGEDRVRAAYGANFDRLTAIKKKFDPDNLFRTNRNIPPA